MTTNSAVCFHVDLKILFSNFIYLFYFILFHFILFCFSTISVPSFSFQLFFLTGQLFQAQNDFAPKCLKKAKKENQNVGI